MFLILKRNYDKAWVKANYDKTFSYIKARRGKITTTINIISFFNSACGRISLGKQIVREGTIN